MKKQISSKVTEAVYEFIDGKVKTQQQMADFIGVDLRTFQRWLVEKNYKSKHKLYTPKQQIEIFILFGYLEDD